MTQTQTFAISTADQKMSFRIAISDIAIFQIMKVYFIKSIFVHEVY